MTAIASQWNPNELLEAFGSLDSYWDTADPLNSGSPALLQQLLQNQQHQAQQLQQLQQQQQQQQQQRPFIKVDSSDPSLYGAVLSSAPGALQDSGGLSERDTSSSRTSGTNWPSFNGSGSGRPSHYDPNNHPHLPYPDGRTGSGGSYGSMPSGQTHGAWPPQSAFVASLQNVPFPQQHQQQQPRSPRSPSIAAPHSLATSDPSSGGGTTTAGKRVRGPKGGAKAQMQELLAVVADKQGQISRLVGDNARLRDRARILELVVRCRSDQVERLQQLAAAIAAAPPAPAVATPVAVAGGDGGSAATAAATSAFLAAWAVRMNGMTLEHMLVEFRATVSEVSAALLDAPSASAPTPRLAKIMESWYDGVKYSILINPEVLKLTGSASASGDTVGDTPEEAHWLSVAGVIGLRPEQAQDCVVLFDLFSAWSHRLMGTRARLGDCLVRLAADNGYGGGAGSLLSAEQLVEQLHKNVVQERCLLVLAGEVMFTKLLTCCQGARVLVHCHPYVPDALAVLAAIARTYRCSLDSARAARA